MKQKMTRKKMARKNRPSQKEYFSKIQDEVDTQKKEAEEKLPAIARDSGGSIDKLPVKTKAFTKWLADHQSSNPFIGKHVTAAPEFNVEQKDIKEAEEVEATPEMLKSFENSEFNPDADDGLQEEDLGKAPKVHNNSDKKFIDITITENATKRLSGKTDDEIKEYAINTMRSYHEDENYETQIEMNSVIEHAKILLLESEPKKKKYLR